SFLWLLKEAQSLGLNVDWVAGGLLEVPADFVAHLAPPRAKGEFEQHEYYIEWRLKYKYGLAYYRKGPNFCLVKDLR
ncbi:DUF5825 family protein, partial [Streptomyces sp. SID5770]|uniref:DUF5825 family protein n=1 Tax=Streptomyces sp. SID5770 TaxID=2690308 RepID=UPI001F208437